MALLGILAETASGQDSIGPLLDYGNVLLESILTRNILLSLFLGMCSFLAISRSLKTAFGLGLAVIFVLTCTAIINYAIYEFVLTYELASGADLTYLMAIVFIMTIAAFVQLVEMVIERTSPVLHINLGIYLPLITVNCAVLGVSTIIAAKVDAHEPITAGKSLVLGFGSGVGWMLAICLMAGIREKLKHADIPRPLQGLGITMIITGIMAMAFTGFKGIDLIKAITG